MSNITYSNYRPVLTEELQEIRSELKDQSYLAARRLGLDPNEAMKAVDRPFRHSSVPHLYSPSLDDFRAILDQVPGATDTPTPQQEFFWEFTVANAKRLEGQGWQASLCSSMLMLAAAQDPEPWMDFVEDYGVMTFEPHGLIGALTYDLNNPITLSEGLPTPDTLKESYARVLAMYFGDTEFYAISDEHLERFQGDYAGKELTATTFATTTDVETAHEDDLHLELVKMAYKLLPMLFTQGFPSLPPVSQNATEYQTTLILYDENDEPALFARFNQFGRRAFVFHTLSKEEYAAFQNRADYIRSGSRLLEMLAHE